MIIRAIKETLGQVFHSPEAMGSWSVECAVDEEKVDCKDFQEQYDEDQPSKDDTLNHYTGVPAPAYLQDDPWFGPAPELTEKQKDYMEQETEMKMLEEQHRSEVTCESHDIHAKIYEIATKNWTTVSETQGGSENFHEGPGGWNSGTGMGQFK
jgi:hypothetical protein